MNRDISKYAVVTVIMLVSACKKTEAGKETKPSTSAAPSSALTLASASASVAAPTEPPKAPAPVPTVLASGQPRPLLVQVDGTNVYWVNRGSSDTSKPAPDVGSVMKVGKGGGAPVTIASRQDLPTALAVDGSSVYWSTMESIRKAKISGGGVTTLYTMPATSGIPSSIALDDATVYFGVRHMATGGLFKVSKTGGGGGPIAGGDASSGFTVDSIALLHDRVVMCIGSGDILASVTLKTKYQQILLKDLKNCQNLAADADDVYWTETSGNKLQRMPWAFMPNPFAMKVADATAATGLVVNGDDVFWVEKSGRIMRAAAHGGETSVVTDQLKSPRGLAVDDTYVYWASPDEGTVSRVARSPEAAVRAAAAPPPSATPSSTVKAGAPTTHTR